jgi:hypothetical protein
MTFQFFNAVFETMKTPFIRTLSVPYTFTLLSFKFSIQPTSSLVPRPSYLGSRIPYVLLAAFFLFFISKVSAQSEIPIGTWRMHLSYNTINSVALGADNVFGAAKNSVMVLDKADNSISTYSKLNGLTGAGISFINYNVSSDQLLIAYEDGNLDIVEGNTVINFNRLKESTAITGSKKINHIVFENTFAYLATDYGVVVFDLTRNEVKETWRDLSVTGTKIKIFQSTIAGDSIFLATEKGVLAGNLNDNLLDYNNWKRFDQGSFSGSIRAISEFNGKIYAAINSVGIYHYENGAWTKETFLQNLIFTSMTEDVNHLFVAEGNNLWQVDATNNVIQITDDLIDKPLFAVEDADGKIWIADAVNGLIADNNGSFNNYLPDGPISSSSHRLKFYNKTLYSLPGGYSSTFNALNNDLGFDSFNNGIWANHSTATRDITDIDFVGDNVYLASFGYGVEKQDAQGNAVIFNEDNSTLVNINPPGKFVNITAVEKSNDGLWVANYGTSNSLHLLGNDQVWQAFSFSTFAARFPTNILVDYYNYVWMILNPLQGGGIMVFDRVNNRTAYLTEVPGAGGLPSKAVYSIAQDRDGYIWVGTDAGVAYFFDSEDVFSGSVDAIKPIFDNRFLLKSEKITAIAIDGGNRKWMGTQNGVWLFNPTGEALVYNFIEANSPLISNIIDDVAINDETGEVFFATDKGIVSFRSDATLSGPSFANVKIFPNPVTAEFNGTVGISGLATDAIVKITDVSGKLIWQTQANGGTATWNLQDVNGHKAVTGIYLVFAATQDAGENIVGKVAVIE